MAFNFNQTPGDGINAVPELNQQILVELRIISLLLAQMNPGVIQPDDLDNLRADPGFLHQRMS